MSTKPHLEEWYKKEIAKDIAVGTPTSKILEDRDISRSSLAKVKREQKAFIEAEQMRWLAATPDAIDIQIDLIKSYDKANALSNPKLFDASIKASELNLKSSGTVPSPTSINLTQINNGVGLAPTVEAIISKLFPSVTGQNDRSIEPVDIEAEEIIE